MKIRSKTKTAFLVTTVKREGERFEYTPAGVATTFASAYKNSTFLAGIAEPDSGYRKAINEMNEKGRTILVDKSNENLSAIIERIPVLVA